MALLRRNGFVPDMGGPLRRTKHESGKSNQLVAERKVQKGGGENWARSRAFVNIGSLVTAFSPTRDDDMLATAMLESQNIQGLISQTTPK